MLLIDKRLELSDFFFLDNDMNKQFYATNVLSLMWHPMFNDITGGDFEIELDVTTPNSFELAKLIGIGWHLASLKNQKIGVITKIREDFSTKENSKMVFSGIMIEGLLENRLFPGSYYTDNYSDKDSVWSEMDVALQLAISAADKDRLIYSQGLTGRRGSLYQNKIIDYNVDSPFRDKNNIENFPLYVDAVKFDDSQSFPVAPKIFELQSDVSVGEQINKTMKRNSNGIGVYPLYIDRVYDLNVLYNEDFIDNREVVELSDDYAYNKENLTMFIYNGRDLTKDIIFSSGNNSLVSVRSVKDLSEIQNNSVVNYIYRTSDFEYKDGQKVALSGTDYEINNFYSNNMNYDRYIDNIFKREVSRTYRHEDEDGNMKIILSKNKLPSDEAISEYYSYKSYDKEENSIYGNNQYRYYQTEVNDDVYMFGRDYNLGDFVSVDVPERGIKTEMMVSGVFFEYESNGSRKVFVELDDYSQESGYKIRIVNYFKNTERAVEGVEYGIYLGSKLLETITSDRDGVAYGGSNLNSGKYSVRMIDRGPYSNRRSTIIGDFEIKNARRPVTEVVYHDYNFAKFKIMADSSSAGNNPRYVFNYGYINDDGTYGSKVGEASGLLMEVVEIKYLNSKKKYSLQIKDFVNQNIGEDFYRIGTENYGAEAVLVVNNQVNIRCSTTRKSIRINPKNTSLFESIDGEFDDRIPMSYKILGDIKHRSSGRYLFKFYNFDNSTSRELYRPVDSFISFNFSTYDDLNSSRQYSYDTTNYKEVGTPYITKDGYEGLSTYVYCYYSREHFDYISYFKYFNIPQMYDRWISYGVKSYGINEVVLDIILDIPAKIDQNGDGSEPMRSVGTINPLDNNKSMYITKKEIYESNQNPTTMDISEDAISPNRAIVTNANWTSSKITLFEYDRNDPILEKYRNIQYKETPKEFNLQFSLFRNGAWTDTKLTDYQSTFVNGARVIGRNESDSSFNRAIPKMKKLSYFLRDDIIITNLRSYNMRAHRPWWKPGEEPEFEEG